MRARVPALCAAAIVAACDVPIESFHPPDATVDVAPPDRPPPDIAGPAMIALEAYAKASNTGADDHFGHSVALSDDGLTLVVGAPDEDSSTPDPPLDNAAREAGAVYVFVRSGATWTQQAYLKAGHPFENDLFGASVALSADGSTLAVGASSEDSSATGIGIDDGNTGAPAAGAAYVFTRSGATWTQQVYIKASNTDANDQFGTSVALSADGSTLAVGACTERSNGTSPDDDTFENAGAAYVFTRTGAAWTQQAYVKPSDGKAFEQFGASVALSDDGATLAVGASPDRSFGEKSTTGKVYVFARTSTTWTEQFKRSSTIPTTLGAFGNSVALSADGSVLAVGAAREDASATSAGAVYLFARTGTSWAQQAYLEAFNVGAGDNFGESVALSADGATLAVGAFFEDSNATTIDGDATSNAAPDAGAVYVLTRGATGWTPRTYFKAINADPDDRFGGSVALSADGATIAVGAIHEDSSATGIGGNPASDAASNAGAVYIFR
jgi:trimeric autotransporter adhesin